MRVVCVVERFECPARWMIAFVLRVCEVSRLASGAEYEREVDHNAWSLRLLELAPLLTVMTSGTVPLNMQYSRDCVLTHPDSPRRLNIKIPNRLALEITHFPRVQPHPGILAIEIPLTDEVLHVCCKKWEIINLAITRRTIIVVSGSLITADCGPRDQKT